MAAAILAWTGAMAITGSLFIVGSIALAGSLQYLRSKLVDWRNVLVFDLPG